MNLDIPDNWVPTTETLKNLPEPLRLFIRALQRNADPDDIVRENFQLRQENEWLRRECDRLAGGSWPPR
jgi:hypothetical protein